MARLRLKGAHFLVYLLSGMTYPPSAYSMTVRVNWLLGSSITLVVRITLGCFSRCKDFENSPTVSPKALKSLFLITLSASRVPVSMFSPSCGRESGGSENNHQEGEGDTLASASCGLVCVCACAWGK